MGWYANNVEAIPPDKPKPQMNQVVPKKVALNLADLDGNAFALMGAFSKAARRQGWTKEETNSVLEKCTKGDYDHLLRTLIAHTENADES